jgi:hypothetical protein
MVASKPLSFKIEPLGLSRMSQTENQGEAAHTPRATIYMNNRQQAELLTKSINTTPTK